MDDKSSRYYPNWWRFWGNGRWSRGLRKGNLTAHASASVHDTGAWWEDGWGVQVTCMAQSNERGISINQKSCAPFSFWHGLSTAQHSTARPMWIIWKCRGNLSSNNNELFIALNLTCLPENVQKCRAWHFASGTVICPLTDCLCRSRDCG